MPGTAHTSARCSSSYHRSNSSCEAGGTAQRSSSITGRADVLMSGRRAQPEGGRQRRGASLGSTRFGPDRPVSRRRPTWENARGPLPPSRPQEGSMSAAATTEEETVSNPRRYRYYDLVMAAFVTVLLCSNLIGPGKTCILFGLTFGAGNLFFPISYIFGDVLTEVYGYARTRKVIWAGFISMIFATVMGLVVIHMPPDPDEPFNAEIGRAARRER